MIKNCAICGREFETNFNHALFCSPECKAKAKQNYRDAHKEEWKERRRLTMKATCLVCGKEFYKNDKHKKYCSDECRKEGDRSLWRQYAKERRENLKDSKAYIEAVHTGKALDANEMEKVLQHYASKDDVARKTVVNAGKAVSKSVRMRRKQNMLLLQQDIIEADKLGISYGQYQEMKGKE